MTELYSADQLSNYIQIAAKECDALIQSDNPNDLVFAGILTNGVFFAQRVVNLLTHVKQSNEPIVLELDASLYRDDFSKNKNYMSISAAKIPQSFNNKHVVLFDDVLATGRTVRAALNTIFDSGRPKKVSLVVLFDRGNREVPIEPAVSAVKVQVSNDLRINTQFIEVVGQDGVVLAPFDA